MDTQTDDRNLVASRPRESSQWSSIPYVNCGEQRIEVLPFNGPPLASCAMLLASRFQCQTQDTSSSAMVTEAPLAGQEIVPRLQRSVSALPTHPSPVQVDEVSQSVTQQVVLIPFLVSSAIPISLAPDCHTRFGAHSGVSGSKCGRRHPHEGLGILHVHRLRTRFPHPLDPELLKKNRKKYWKVKLSSSQNPLCEGPLVRIVKCGKECRAVFPKHTRNAPCSTSDILEWVECVQCGHTFVPETFMYHIHSCAPCEGRTCDSDGGRMHLFC